VRLAQLRLGQLRSFESLELDLDPGWNVFVGPNGAGKTTILEAAYLLSHARSFRSNAAQALTRRGTDGFTVYGRVELGNGAYRGVGLARSSGALEARLDGDAVPVAELLRQVAVSCFEPGSHELLSGASEIRRRFLDWGVFHVEHGFLSTWRAYQRALKQRNALLRGDGGGAARGLEPWDLALARSGTGLNRLREAYAEQLAPATVDAARVLIPELGAPSLDLSPAWESEAQALAELAEARPDDVRRGFTTRGPHRADWSLTFEFAPRREHLSRGQEKLCALACVLGQATVFAQVRGEWPIVCIDDLASELDQPHQEKLLRALAGVDAQILISGTHAPHAIASVGARSRMFHVEPGSARPLI
jgi:DNA replication and repair protein RecF